MTTQTKYTRADYMGHRATHRQYYAQFANAAIRHRVKHGIGIDALKASRDTEYFNDIPLIKWDRLAAPCPHEVGVLMREAGDYPTLAGLVCALKEAARQLVEESATVSA